MPSSLPTSPAEPPARERIAREALALLQEVGMEAFTTRALAARLGVKSPALYWHFANKQELFVCMLDALFEGVAEPRGDQDCGTWLMGIARRNYRQLTAQRDGALVLLAAKTTPRIRQLVVPTMMAGLLSAGFDEASALSAIHTLAAFVTGWVVAHQEGLSASFMSAEEATECFEFGLRTIVAGLMAQRTGGPAA